WMLDVSTNRSQEDRLFSGTGLNTVLLNQRAAGVANGVALPADQHLNLFGNGTAQTAAAMEGLLLDGGFSPTRTNKSKMHYTLLTAEGPLVRMPAGELRLAVGAELRGDTLEYTDRVLINNSPERDVSAAFAEVAVPLIGERNRIRGVYALDV